MQNSTIFQPLMVVATHKGKRRKICHAMSMVCYKKKKKKKRAKKG